MIEQTDWLHSSVCAFFLFKLMVSGLTLSHYFIGISYILIVEINNTRENVTGSSTISLHGVSIATFPIRERPNERKGPVIDWENIGLRWGLERWRWDAIRMS